MKMKYIAAGLLSTAFISCGVAYQFASAAEGGWQPGSDTQLQSLDVRLGEKVAEFLELNELLTRQLESVRLNQQTLPNEPLLTGNEVVSEPVATEPEIAPAPAPVRQPPWWSRYQVSMVVYSNGSRSAVINGRYVRNGDALAPGVRVRSISPGQVMLARGEETARLTVGGGK